MRTVGYWPTGKTFATTGTDLEGVMLSETSQPEKHTGSHSHGESRSKNHTIPTQAPRSQEELAGCVRRGAGVRKAEGGGRKAQTPTDKEAGGVRCGRGTGVDHTAVCV